MLKYLLLLLVVFFTSCSTTTFFVVRHAEKETNTMTSDVALSEKGRQRAEALKELLKDQKIGTVYSTNYIRTKSTAKPLAEAVGVTIQVYDPRDSTFISRIVNTGNKDREGNMLIVGHSNTVDDIVNALMGSRVVPGDLPETQYGDLYVVKKRGKKFILDTRRFGE
ncbi:MAG: SixA phosphatase family protein [Flavisolibacter sp.]